ncbi:hypothetical protein SKAU_G00315010 [Synaphobranchus kaupii]|uniref:Uncharacterized protein n=1 Tax=Synaphobranchus kaupii TaxID=118154 RepID=A0A9Q1ILL9_SYNKA|nr:hypothetical protein SKAU_G00315010 [Synaphobranchus kaupii]
MEGQRERGGQRGVETEGGGLVRAAGPVQEQAPGSTAAETGNHSEGDNDSAESPCGVKGELLQPETTEESSSQSSAQMERTEDCLSLSDLHMESHSNQERARTEEHSGQSETNMEITEECISQSYMQIERTEECLSQSQRGKPDTAAGDTKLVYTPLSLPELTVDEENPTDEMVQTIEHTKCQHLPFPECDITSCSSATEAGGEKERNGEDGRACDVSAGTAPLLSGSPAEMFHLPEDSRKTTSKQEVLPPEVEDKIMLLANDGTLSSQCFHCPLSRVNADSDVRREEGRSEEKAVTSLSKEPHPQLLSNQGKAETLNHENSAYSQGAAQCHCRGSEPNQEAELWSEVTEIDTGGINVYSVSQTEETTLRSEVMQTVTGGSDVHSDSQIEESRLGSVVTETAGSDVHADIQIEETTLGSEVMETVTGGSDVHLDSPIEKTELGSEVMEAVTGGGDVHSDSCTEETTLGSEVTETVTGGSEVHSDSQIQETNLGSEVTQAVKGGSDVHLDSQIEETKLGSRVTEMGGSDVHSESQIKETTLGSEITQSVTGQSDVHSHSQIEETQAVTCGSDVHSESQIEETTLGSEVTQSVTGGSDVHSDSQIEETKLGSEVMETVTCGNDVHSKSQIEETTLGSEVTQSVTGGSDVHSDSQIEETKLESEVMETVTCGNDVHSESQIEKTTLGSAVTQSVTDGSDVHLDSCAVETTSEREVDTQEHESADLEVVSLNNVSSGTMSCPTEGEEPARDPTLTMGRESEEKLECVDNEHATPQATSHDGTASKTSSEIAIADCSSTAEGHGPSLDPALELGRGEEQCKDVEKRNTSKVTHNMPATEDVSMVNQEDCQGAWSSDAGDEAEIHRESDSYRPTHLCADPHEKEKQDVEPAESSPCLTPRSAGSSSSAPPARFGQRR